MEILEEHQDNAIFAEVGELIRFPANSVVIQKREGYSCKLKFYNMLNGSIHLPLSKSQLQLIIENKDIATLYEIWTYIKTIKVLERCTNSKPIVAIAATTDEFSANFDYKISVEFRYNGKKITLYYNKTYSRGRGSYSLTLSPDIVMEIGKDKYIFDAKFKVRTISWDDEEKDDKFTFKHEDICKMHTYKDAIEGVRYSCILYPNPEGEAKILEESPGFGVGAIPLPANRNCGELEAFIFEVLDASGYLG